MIGGPPVVDLPPGFSTRPPFVPPSGVAPAVAAPQTRVAIAMPPPARFPTGPAPKISPRARGEEEAVSAPVTLPSPEQAGVARRHGADLEWAEAHRRLDEMGIVDFQIKPNGDGGFRFACLMPSGQPDRFYRIEGQGTTQREAVRVALERAAPYKRGRG